MKHHRLSVVLMFLILSVAPCLAHHMAVVVDKDNKVGNVTSTHLAKIFRAEIKKWPDGRDVVLVLHSASSGDVSLARVAAGAVSLASLSGDLDVGVAPGIGLYLDLSSLSGQITNELDDSGAEQTADARLTCRTVSGDVRIHRAGRAA